MTITLREKVRRNWESRSRFHSPAPAGFSNLKEDSPHQLHGKDSKILRALLGLLFLISLPLMAEPPQLPSGLIDLSLWKLQLPEDTARPGHPDEVKQPELENFSHPSFFFLSKKHDALVFRAPCGGATTKNSKYPRSELREVTAEGKRASWPTSSEDLHILKARLAIAQLPKVKPHLVCAQIHDTHDDLLVIRLEKNHLFIRRDNLPKITLNSAYQLGTPFSFEIHSGQGSVLVFYEGKKCSLGKSKPTPVITKAAATPSLTRSAEIPPKPSGRCTSLNSHLVRQNRSIVPSLSDWINWLLTKRLRKRKLEPNGQTNQQSA